MPWQPAQGTQPLSPFDHQVAGQSSMLRYDKTTVCKPLIAREHFVYKSLPPDLAEFTPEYRGEIEVELIEEDGYIQLYGLHVDDDVWPCTSQNHGHETANMKSKLTSKDSFKNRSTVRLLRSGSYEVSASTNQVFYTADSKPDQPHTQSLNPWSLKNHKRLLDKMRKSEHSHDKIRFILLKNVVADFCHPCILDLKIGSRLHGDDASSVKVASQSEKCRRTTSSSLGVRLCGMQVYQVEANAYHSVDKYHGRTLNEQSFRLMLYNFLHNGTRFRSELIQPIVSRLSELIKCLEGLHSFRFYASSLLIIYDGDVGVTTRYNQTKVQESKPGCTADLVSADNISDRVHSSKHLVQNKQQSEGVFSSKELGLQGSNTQEKHHQLPEKVCQAGGLKSSEELGLQESNTQEKLHQLSEKVCQASTSEELGLQESNTQEQLHQLSEKVCQASTSKELGLQGSNTQEKLHQLSEKVCQASTSQELGLDGNNTQEQLHHLSKQICQASSLQSSKEACLSVATQPTVEHTVSYKESSESVKTQTFDSSCGPSCIYLPGNFPRSHDNSSEQPHSVSDVFECGLLVAELSPSNSAPTQMVRDDPSKTIITHQHSHTPNKPLLTPSSKTDSIKQVLNKDKHSSVPESSKIGDTCLQNNHRIYQVPKLLDIDKQSVCHSVSSQDTVNPEQQTEPLDTCKQLLKTDNPVNVTLPSSISSIVPSETHVPPACHTQSPQVHITEKLPVTEYGVTNDDLIQIPHDSVDLAFNDKSIPEVDQPKDYVSVCAPSSEPTDVTSQVKQNTSEGSNDTVELQHCSRNNVKVDVKMIDFAHTTHQGFTMDQIKHTGPDTDYISGLRNLLNLFQELLGSD